MTSQEVVPGIERAWTLIEKLGEGDAGEVFRVESLIEKQTAILKRPRRSAFTSDTVRQAAQIEREANILRALAGLSGRYKHVSAPQFLDQSKPGNEFSDRFFIIFSEAKGINLAALARAVRFGTLNEDEMLSLAPAGLSEPERAYLQTITNSQQIPQLILLRILDGMLEFLGEIHALELSGDNSVTTGIIWNDIKAEHVFYDPQTTQITLIDWGNGRFLEEGGATSDRQHSRLDDYTQFLDEMGRFLATTAEDLYTALSWPDNNIPGFVYSENISPLHTHIQKMRIEAIRNLEQARRVEKELLASTGSSYTQYQQLEQVQRQLQLQGEIPNLGATRHFAQKIAQELISAGDLEHFQLLCAQLAEDKGIEANKWKFLSQISALISSEPALRSCLHYALQEQWINVLWELRLAARYEPFPAWWEEFSALARELELNGGSLAITPKTAMNRLILALQSISRQDAAAETPSPDAEAGKGEDRSSAIHVLLHSLREDGLRRWSELEPDPPDSDIGYQEVYRYAQDIRDLAPAAGQALFHALDQPAAQVQIVLDAWERLEFETARRGLRRILIWDPDRRRLLTADLAIQSASGWLERLRKGPNKDEALQDFVTRYELEGRELRNQVGPASWLDAILSALRQLRRGSEPTEVMMDFTAARPYLAWLLELEPHRPILSTPGKILRLERNPAPSLQEPGLRGIRETRFGEGQEIQLGDLLDTWAPEAAGSSARVFRGLLRGQERGADPCSDQIDATKPDGVCSAALSRRSPNPQPAQGCPGDRIHVGVWLSGNFRRARIAAR